jgi:hypothetical protein
VNGIPMIRHTTIAALVLFATPALAQTTPLSDGPVTCSSPVSAGDSAKSLMQRYGQEAVMEDNLSTGVEDITYRGLVLLPRSVDWRIEVAFADETMSRVARLTLRNSAKASHWNVAGVTIGSTLAEVQKINGKPFLVHGFDSDFSGFVVSWKGGKLDGKLPGGCRVGVRFGKDNNSAPDLSAERIPSDNGKLLKWGPVVEQIEVSFSDK